MLCLLFSVKAIGTNLDEMRLELGILRNIVGVSSFVESIALEEARR